MTGRWRQALLGEVATLQRGFDLPYRLRKRGPFPVVTSSGLEDTHATAAVKGPGVVTGRYGTIGNVFFVRGDFWPLNTTLYVRDFHGHDPLFISYLLRTIDFHSHSGKSGVPGVNRNDLHELSVLIPSTKTEQEAIAKTLSDADAYVDSLERLLTKKRDIKQGLEQNLLTGCKRLPEYDCGAGFQHTDVGAIPNDWQIISLSDFAQLKSGYAITSQDIDDCSAFPCYGGNGLRGRTARFTHEGEYALIGRQGALCGNVILVKGKFFASEHAIVVTPRARTDVRWLAFVLQRMHLNQYSESSAQPGLSVRKLLCLPLATPPTEAEQGAIAVVLSDAAAEIAALEATITKARAIKAGMMQNLLTGKVRLV